MYRNAELRRYQYYVNPTWTGTYFVFRFSVFKHFFFSKVVSTAAQACLVPGELVAFNNLFTT